MQKLTGQVVCHKCGKNNTNFVVKTLGRLSNMLVTLVCSKVIRNLILLVYLY